MYDFLRTIKDVGVKWDSNSDFIECEMTTEPKLKSLEFLIDV